MDEDMELMTVTGLRPRRYAQKISQDAGSMNQPVCSALGARATISGTLGGPKGTKG